MPQGCGIGGTSRNGRAYIIMIITLLLSIYYHYHYIITINILSLWSLSLWFQLFPRDILVRLLGHSCSSSGTFLFVFCLILFLLLSIHWVFDSFFFALVLYYYCDHYHCYDKKYLRGMIKSIWSDYDKKYLERWLLHQLTM